MPSRKITIRIVKLHFAFARQVVDIVSDATCRCK